MNFKFLLTSAFVFFISLTTINAQSKEERAQKWVQEKVVARMNKINPSLTLTAEQNQKFVSAQLADMDKIAEINKLEISEEEKTAKKQEVYKAVWPLVNSILNPEQLKAWKEGKM